jgi:hypothetical protein
MGGPVKLPDGIGRDIRDDVCRRTLDVSGDELGGEGRRAADPVLLPCTYVGARRAVVDDSGTRRCKCEAAAAAFAAALDRPTGRGAAAAAADTRKDA